MKHLKTFEKLNDDIFNAIYHNDLTTAKKVIESGIDIEHLNLNGWTPLYFSVCNNNIEIVKELIKCGSNVNFQNKYKNTPLIIAAYYKNFDIVKLLIEAGADWNIKDNNNKDFIDFLNNEQKKQIVNKYPEKYEEYLAKKEAEKYNI